MLQYKLVDAELFFLCYDQLPIVCKSTNGYRLFIWQQVLDRQRLEAMQKLEQHDADMRARMELLKQQAHMRQMQLHGFPQVGVLQTNIV